MSTQTPNSTQSSPVLRVAPDVNYWTEDRIRAVKPITLPRETLSKIHLPVTPVGELGHVPPAPGHLEQGLQPHGTLGLSKTGGAAVPNPLAYPYRTCGRLFFNQGSGGFSGSASLISPNVLLTAGHCVYNGGVWSSNMVFYPSYGSRQSTDPNYRFACGRMWCWTAWTSNGNRAYDYAMVWIGTNPPPGNALGWLGLMWNAGTSGRVWDELGYPGEPAPFNGSVMDGCEGTYSPSSISNTFGLTPDHMGHGSSGGPWITAYNNENPPVHANSVVSYGVSDPPQVVYGPYFTADVQTLFTTINQPGNH